MDKEAICEQELVEQASFNHAAFEMVYKRYFDRIFRYVAARVDHPQDVEDLVAEIFMRVFKALSRCHNQHEQSFSAWVFTIARHMIADYYRKRGREPQEIALDRVADTSASNGDPKKLVIAYENDAEFQQLLLFLPQRQREIIILRFFNGMRNKEIAIALQIDERTVAAHLSKGLKSLYHRIHSVRCL